MPEEINRVLTDQMSDLLFCPTDTAVTNLNNEGISEKVHLVGDIMYDAALHFGRLAQTASCNNIIDGLSESNYILATIHRQENTDNKLKLKKIVLALSYLSQTIPVVLPLHPRTKASLDSFGLTSLLVGPLLQIVEPLSYFEMLVAMQSASLIVTDSGGVQKEAFFFGVPCVTLRDQTEWVELVDSGWNILVDVLNDDITNSILTMIGREGQSNTKPYGEGNAATIMYRHISKKLGL